MQDFYPASAGTRWRAFQFERQADGAACYWMARPNWASLGYSPLVFGSRRPGRPRKGGINSSITERVDSLEERQHRPRAHLHGEIALR